jgi:hypothetical protein
MQTFESHATQRRWDKIFGQRLRQLQAFDLRARYQTASIFTCHLKSLSTFFINRYNIIYYIDIYAVYIYILYFIYIYITPKP